MGNGVTFEDNSDEVKGDMFKAAIRGLVAIGMTAEGYAKEKAPVGTPESTHKKKYIGGQLRNSITNKVDKSEMAVYIGSNVEYAPYVELGTRKMSARPFLKPAATEHSDEYKNLIEESLKSG